MTNQGLRVLTIFGTRPEVIKLFPVIDRLRHDYHFGGTVLSTSQHREMIDELIQLFSIEVGYDLDIMQHNQSLLDISKRTMSGLDCILKELQPHLVLVQGDTTTAFIAALAAFYHKIPIGHVEAGLRSFDKMQPYPEEINRRLISVVGDLHFAPTTQNARNLFKEGVNEQHVFVTGNTVIDALHNIVDRKLGLLSKYLPSEVLNSHRMILVTAHRRENWGEPLANLCEALKDLVRFYSDVIVVYPVHLNPNVRTTVFESLANEERVHLLEPLPYAPFVEAMAMAHIIITDSGGIQEEAPTFQKPVLVFRHVTERSEGLDTGGVKLIGLDRKDVVREASRLLNDPSEYRQMQANGNPYGDGRAAERVVQAILHHFGLADRPEDFRPSKMAEGVGST